MPVKYQKYPNSLHELIPYVDVPVGKAGNAEIYQFSVSSDETYDQVLRAELNGGNRWIPPGTYTALKVDGVTVMCDSPDEKKDHEEFVSSAGGTILISGLGIGMCANAVCMKRNVDRVTVVEKSQGVIDLVAPALLQKYGNKLSVIHCDIFDFNPREYFNYVWHDIWPYASAEFFDEMQDLEERFHLYADWIDSWGWDVGR